MKPFPMQRQEIFIIDDDQSTLTFLQMALADVGYDVVPWTTCGDTLAGIRRIQPALVMLALQLDDDNPPCQMFLNQFGSASLKILSQLSFDQRAVQIPVILMASSLDLLLMNWTSLTAMRCATLQKPVDRDALHEALRSALA